MEFEEQQRQKNNENNYHIENLRIAREFSKELLKEMKELVRSIVLFGSNTHDTLKKDSDIDMMIVLDNISVFVSDELKSAYRVITTNLNSKISTKLHIMTMNLSDLWDMARKGDPILINILRYGLPIFDRDLVEPLQYLLEIGKIRPTKEAIYNYMSRSQTLFEETKKHLEDAILDMYYSVIDMTHAVLMTQKIMPPSPKEMPQIFKNTFKGKPLEKYSKDIEKFYLIAKEIEHEKNIKIDGILYNKLKKKADRLISELKIFNDKELGKKDIFEL